MRGMVVVALLCGVSAMPAQEIAGIPARSAAKSHVSFAAEPATVEAGKPAVVELRFRVQDGFHVNSHKPASELLIPTSLSVNSAAVKVVRAEYPLGTNFKLGDETLDVYQGEFRVRVTVVAPRGESTLAGSLRYQACDQAACFPPRDLPVSVVVTGR